MQFQCQSLEGCIAPQSKDNQLEEKDEEKGGVIEERVQEDALGRQKLRSAKKTEENTLNELVGNFELHF